MNDVEVFDRDNFTSTTTTTTTSTTNTPELLNQADRQMFLRKLELGLITTTTTQSTTTTPTTTTTSAKLTTTKSKTTKRPNYKYSRPTYFFSAPTFGPPCYCPCLTSASYGSQKYDPFEEQKLLFDLERARGYSTEDPLTTTQGMTEEEMTTIIPDTFRYIQEEGDSILEEQIEFTTTMTTPHGRSLNYTNLESQEEVSTYYPIQNEDEEPITDLPPLEPIKPRFFQVCRRLLTSMYLNVVAISLLIILIKLLQSFIKVSLNKIFRSVRLREDFAKPILPLPSLQKKNCEKMAKGLDKI